MAHFGEGSEGEGALHLTDMVVEYGLRAVWLRQVEAVVHLQTLANRLQEKGMVTSKK